MGQSVIDFENLIIQNDEALKQSGDLDFNLDETIKEHNDNLGDEQDVEENKNDLKKSTSTEEDLNPTKDEKPEKGDNQSVKDFTNVAKELLASGEWDDVLIEVEDGKEVKLSEIEDLDKDTFLAIWKEQQKTSEEQIKENYIPIKGIDENRKRLIDIVANGGDLTEIFSSPEQLKRPYEDIDITDQKTAQSVLYSFYIKGKGLEEEEARDLVLKATKDMTLDQKAQQVVTHVQAKYDENIKKLAEDVKKQKEEERKALLEYKKNLSSLYKEDEIEDSLSKQFVEAATKEKDGQIYIDTVYEEMMKDPQKAKDLIFFMLEKDKYLTKVGAKIKRDAHIGTLKTVRILKDTSKTSNVSQEEDKSKKKSPFDDLVLPD